MAQATNQNISKTTDMDFVARTVMVLANGVLTNDQDQILASAQALADECDIPVPDFDFVA
jgi:hypothetical protein